MKDRHLDISPQIVHINYEDATGKLVYRNDRNTTVMKIYALVCQWCNPQARQYARYISVAQRGICFQINSATSGLPGCSHHLGLLSPPLQKHLHWLWTVPFLSWLSSVLN